jgi:hypothetical protein
MIVVQPWMILAQYLVCQNTEVSAFASHSGQNRHGSVRQNRLRRAGHVVSFATPLGHSLSAKGAPGAGCGVMLAVRGFSNVTSTHASISS